MRKTLHFTVYLHTCSVHNIFFKLICTVNRYTCLFCLFNLIDLVFIESCKLDSWKPSWIQIYKSDRSNHASFQTFYISKITELYLYDEFLNNPEFVVDDKILNQFIDSKLKKDICNNNCLPLSDKIDFSLQGAFCIDLLQLLKYEIPNHKLLINWLTNQFRYLIYDTSSTTAAATTTNQTNNNNNNNNNNATTIDDFSKSEMKLQNQSMSALLSPKQTKIEHLSFKQTHKDISLQRRHSLRKLIVQLRSNKLLTARAFVSLTSYQITIQRIFYTWRLYCRRKHVSHVIASKLNQMKQLKKDIFYAWREYTNKYKILRLQEKVEYLQTELRRATIDAFVLQQRAISFNNQEHAIKSVLVAACDFLNEHSCHDCHNTWTSKYASSFQKQFGHNVFLKSIL